jgi:hypothetical protein
VNFVTQAAADGRIDPDKLAGRVSRVMLGQRIDCAQCHDHPFAPYTQGQFEGLAASFAQVKLTAFGVEDDPLRVHRVEAPEEGRQFTQVLLVDDVFHQLVLGALLAIDQVFHQAVARKQALHLGQVLGEAVEICGRHGLQTFRHVAARRKAGLQALVTGA